jgi:cytochrome c oxidase subunit 2
MGLPGCHGVQSTFSAQGAESLRVLRLFWSMGVGAVLIVAVLVILAYVAVAGDQRYRRALSNERTIVVGGVLFPAMVLSLLLIYGFHVIADEPRTAAGGAEPMRIEVVGERWWWRIRYLHADGTYTESANEIRIPIDRPVEIKLTSADVIHRFWVPAYAGKVDMIPGRETTLRLQANASGIVRGQCAEYCGGAHALMSFYVVALAPDEFAAWLSEERGAIRAEADDDGLGLFVRSGCGGCHAIRGTSAVGTIGPNLTHVGQRLSLGAGLLPAEEPDFARWIASHQELKPGNSMPPYGILTEAERRFLAGFLSSLE